MSPLTKKLWRTVWNTRGQFLATAAVVMVGVSVYISMTTAFYNLERSKELFYRENNFADYYFHVIRAPQEITRQIEQVPGVTRATGRIQKDVPVIKENNRRATARVISYPLPMAAEVNRLELLTGRLFVKYPPGGGSEVLLDPQYAAANGLGLNAAVTIVAEGRRVPLRVVGTATSPEFVYPMKDAASLVPEPETFGIFMIPHNQAQHIFNLPGQINQVVVKLAPGADRERVAARVKAILEPYGNLASYPRKQQLSHAVLQGELDGLRATSRFLPAIFLGIAAAIQFVMLGRMVKAQRLQIGVMKALGYNNRQIVLHYTGYAFSVAVFGAFVGILLGLLFASLISETCALFFNLPQAIGGVNWKAIFSGFILSTAVGAIAGLAATRSVVAINPAVSMRPEPPRSAGKIILERCPWLWRRLDPAWKMCLRAAGRNRARFGVTLAGIIFAVGMLVVSFFANDSIDYILQKHFYQEQNYDYLIRFAAPLKENELITIGRLDGVLKAEPLLEVPVRVHFGGRFEEDVLLGLPPGVTLKKLFSETERPLQLPEEGMLISQRTAEKLGVQVGDRVAVETLLGLGPSRRAVLKIAGFNRQLIGGGSYVSLAQANRILQESRLISGAMLKVDPGKAERVEKRLNEMTGIASILSRQKELNNFHQVLDSMLYFTGVMIAFAVVLGFAVVYNSSVMNFAERKRELAAMRVLGFTAQEVSGLLWKETVLQSLLGVILGLPFGYFMALGYTKAVSTDLYSFPAVVYPATYALSALGTVFFILIAYLFALKNVKRLDVGDVLKNRDKEGDGDEEKEKALFGGPGWSGAGCGGIIFQQKRDRG